MTMAPALSRSAKLRYGVGATMYFAQGLPYGLLSIAIPAWLAAEGASAGDIASYLAVIILPWAFKLVTGPLMDRFQMPAMGIRRPWVLAAQLGMALAFLALVTIDNPTEQIGALSVLGILINIFAATQDVAVDGMAIDLTPVREQGKLNAFMAFGKTIGWSVTAAISGTMLVTVGLAPTALAAAIVSGIIFLAFLFISERPGERRLPWSKGEAQTEEGNRQGFRSVFGGLNKVLWQRASLVAIGIMFFDGMVSGYGQALMPIAAVNLFGFTTSEWSNLVAIMGLIGAVAALAFGPVIDRIGSKRTLFITVAVVLSHALVLAQTQALWENSLYVRGMLAIWVMMSPIVMVCIIALAMSICSSSISATQFAIYMSCCNLGASAGSKIFGYVSEGIDYSFAFLLISMISAIVILFVILHKSHQQDGRSTPMRFAATGGGGTGATFFSGAMRCPKCRADMEQLDHGGVVIDRCEHCRGLWFDVGEVELLKKQKAAVLLDVGDPRLGAIYDAAHRYDCPRCGDEMMRMTDKVQSHIWFEKCKGCQGSFFDAGEFADLSKLTLSDFFKRFST